MLLNYKKTIHILFSSLVLTSISAGGVVNAGQTVVSTGQNAVSTEPKMLQTRQITPRNYRFPPPNALRQLPTQAPVSRTAKPTAPVINRPIRPAAGRMPPYYARPRPMPYPGRHQYAPPMPPQHSMPNNGIADSAYSTRPKSVPIAPPFGPGGSPAYGKRSYGPGAYNANPYNRGQYNAGPYNRGPYGNNSPFSNNPMDNFGFGPFSKNSNTAPWETWPFGGRDSLWNRREMPFKNQSPTDWFQPGDPKEGMAIMWDDLISSPDELGEMPGGWNVPSISVPNPVDLEDQLEKASKEVPDLIRIYN
ncbi:MAG: hypothetical protein KZQ83_10540 [gamma proteobacterium symbiont of Taylorina sp.]|nr:hypothetical protein [gamma proteobacterium symbiont of Taylorina sp.]